MAGFPDKEALTTRLARALIDLKASGTPNCKNLANDEI